MNHQLPPSSASPQVNLNTTKALSTGIPGRCRSLYAPNLVPKNNYLWVRVTRDQIRLGQLPLTNVQLIFSSLHKALRSPRVFIFD